MATTLPRPDEAAIRTATLFARPFFEDKARAFWVLQAIGWSGYLILRSVSTLSNGFGLQTIVSNIVEAIVGYCITLLLSTLYGYYRRFPRITGVLLSIFTLGAATFLYALLDAFSFSFIKLAAPGIDLTLLLGTIFINFTVLAGWSALYFGINFYLIVEEQIDQMQHLETQASSAQLAMLRYQLNPHFLFNTLNSISTLVLLKQTERANAMLSRLSSFLRYTLANEPTANVTIAQEIETLKLYLEIEKMRFEDRLRPKFDVDPAVEKGRLPSLLLQPLVENAIKYAVTPQGGRRRNLRFRAARRGSGAARRIRYRAGIAGKQKPAKPFNRRRHRQYQGATGTGLWPGPYLQGAGHAAGRVRGRDRDPVSARRAAQGDTVTTAGIIHRPDRAAPASENKTIMTIRTILVDDEPLAIQGLELRLQAHDDVEIVAKCQNGREAISAIKTHKPDLVFLDIQMPGFDGFSVVQGMMEVEPPLFVFVTAYSDHALRAFEAQAVDYLMKPVEEARLADTLDRVRQRLSEKRGVEENEKLKEVLAEVAPEAAADMAGDMVGRRRSEVSANRFEKLINIKDRGQIFRVDVDTIERIDAAGDYMCIYTGDNTLILRETMKDLEKRLDPRRFQRVHRSTIVNLDLVKQVKPHTNGECFLVLDSGASVKVSRSYRDVVARFVH